MNSNLHSSGVDTSFCSLLYANLLKSKYLLLLLLLLLFTPNLEQSLPMAFPSRMLEHPHSYPFKPQYPHTNSPDQSLYISLKN